MWVKNDCLREFNQSFFTVSNDKTELTANQTNIKSLEKTYLSFFNFLLSNA